jgi:REP element-mobilizing transposase RayT
MPDHLHLLVMGSDDSDLPGFVKDFKQRTGYAYRRATAKALWQKSYHDHVVRAEEDVREVARYIVSNPVRAGLVATATEFPYSGWLAWGRSVLEA